MNRWSVLLRSGARITLECATAPCVVTHTWQKTPRVVRALVNPANTALCGTLLPYFPRGGPVPLLPADAALRSSSWGGMDAGDGMMYPVQAVDGVVHAHGGCGLRKALTAATPAPTVPSCHLSCRSTNGHSSLDTLPT